MKAYVAAPSSDLDSARMLMAEVRDAGFEITHDWTVGFEDETPADYRERSKLDIDGVIAADVLIADCRILRRGGPLIEIGAALGVGVPVVSIGGFHVFFENHPSVTVCRRSTRACLLAARVARRKPDADSLATDLSTVRDAVLRYAEELDLSLALSALERIEAAIKGDE